MFQSIKKYYMYYEPKLIPLLSNCNFIHFFKVVILLRQGN